jgi:hypothetical protein
LVWGSRGGTFHHGQGGRSFAYGPPTRLSFSALVSPKDRPGFTALPEGGCRMISRPIRLRPAMRKVSGCNRSEKV